MDMNCIKVEQAQFGGELEVKIEIISDADDDLKPSDDESEAESSKAPSDLVTTSSRNISGRKRSASSDVEDDVYSWLYDDEELVQTTLSTLSPSIINHSSQNSSETLQPALYDQSLCDRTLLSHDILTSHEEHLSNESPYRCLQCDYRCDQSCALKDHVKSEHVEKLHKCCHCDYETPVECTMQRHLRTHSSDKPYKCSYCNYRSKSSGGLREHIRTHSSDKPYKCPYCDYASKLSGGLRKHKRIHFNDKPFQCSECDYASRQSNGLMRHMRIHSDDKPYKCELCHFRSKYKDNVKLHMVKRHGAVMCSPVIVKPKPSELIEIQPRENLGANEVKEHSCPLCGCRYQLYIYLQRHLRTFHRVNSEPVGNLGPESIVEAHGTTARGIQEIDTD